MSATDELRRLLDERGVEWTEEDGHTLWWGESTHHRASAYSSVLFGEDGRVYLNAMVTPEQAIAATLGNERLAFLEEKVKRQGEYIVKLTKEKEALFAQNCEAATRHAGQMDRMQRKLEAATLGNDGVGRTNDGVDERGTCHIEQRPNAWGGFTEHCGKCGADLGCDTRNTQNFCPKCGTELVK